MNILQRIWDDVRHGENLDLAVLTLFNVNVQSLISPVTLTVLGILAVSALVNRYKVDELIEKVAQPRESKFSSVFPSTFITDLEQAKDLWILGFSLKRSISSYYSTVVFWISRFDYSLFRTQIPEVKVCNYVAHAMYMAQVARFERGTPYIRSLKHNSRGYYSAFEQILKRGGSIRFLLVHPGGRASEMAALKLFPRVRIERYHELVRSNLEQLCQLQQISSGSVEIRTTDVLPGFTIFAINPNTASGVLYLSYLPFESSSEHRPKFILRPSDSYSYSVMERDLLTHWENASVWRCEPSS